MATTDANGFITIENSDLFNISHANGNAAAASAVATRVTTAEGAISDIQTALGVVRDSIRILKPTLQITEHFGGDTGKNFLIIDYYGNAVIHIDRYGLDGQQYEGDSVNIMNLPTINGVQLKWARNYDVAVEGSDNHFYCLHCVQGQTSMNLKKGIGDSGSYFANFDFTYDGVFELTA